MELNDPVHKYLGDICHVTYLILAQMANKDNTGAVYSVS